MGHINTCNTSGTTFMSGAETFVGGSAFFMKVVSMC